MDSKKGCKWEAQVLFGVSDLGTIVAIKLIAWQILFAILLQGPNCSAIVRSLVRSSVRLMVSHLIFCLFINPLILEHNPFTKRGARVDWVTLFIVWKLQLPQKKCFKFCHRFMFFFLLQVCIIDQSVCTGKTVGMVYKIWLLFYKSFLVPDMLKTKDFDYYPWGFAILLLGIHFGASPGPTNIHKSW